MSWWVKDATGLRKMNFWQRIFVMFHYASGLAASGWDSGWRKEAVEAALVAVVVTENYEAI